MANGEVGVGFGISNTAVGVAGAVALALIGGYTITKLAKENMEKHYWRGRHHGIHHAHQWQGVMSHRHIMDSIYNECVMNASHPETVHKNRDRIYRAIHQRAPHVKELIMKGHKGEYGPGKMAEGIQNMSEDILLQFDIPQKPHESAANPRLVQLFKNQRHNDINYRYSIPGGLVLDPYERQYLDKEILSYAGEGSEERGGFGGRDHVGEFLGRERERAGFFERRLNHYYDLDDFRWRYRRQRALWGILPPWLLGNIEPVGPYYQPYPVYGPVQPYPTWGPDLLHPNLFPGYQPPLLLPFEGFPPFGFGGREHEHDGSREHH